MSKREWTFHTGIFADTPNKNGRIYPIDLLHRIAEEASKKPIFGELKDPDSLRDDLVDSARITHVVRRMEVTGDPPELVGSVVFTDGTPMGPGAEDLALAFKATSKTENLKLGIRALGRVVDGVVQDDLKVIAFDLVCEPEEPKD